MESGHVIPSHFSNLAHLPQLVSVPGNQIKKGQFVEILDTLVRHFQDLVISLKQGLLTQSVPKTGHIHLLGNFQSRFDIAALQGQLKASSRVLDKLQGYLGIPLLLQIRDDALTDQITGPDDVHDSVIVLSAEGELKFVLGRVDCDNSDFRFTV